MKIREWIVQVKVKSPSYIQEAKYDDRMVSILKIYNFWIDLLWINHSLPEAHVKKQ